VERRESGVGREGELGGERVPQHGGGQWDGLARRLHAAEHQPALPCAGGNLDGDRVAPAVTVLPGDGPTRCRRRSGSGSDRNAPPPAGRGGPTAWRRAAER
jgi:hypothetical protein